MVATPRRTKAEKVRAKRRWKAALLAISAHNYADDMKMSSVPKREKHYSKTLGTYLTTTEIFEVTKDVVDTLAKMARETADPADLADIERVLEHGA